MQAKVYHLAMRLNIYKSFFLKGIDYYLMQFIVHSVSKHYHCCCTLLHHFIQLQDDKGSPALASIHWGYKKQAVLSIWRL